MAGMRLTLRHLWDARRRRSNNNIAGSGYFNEQNGMVTLQYPFETMPIPDNGRYRLHNEMDDCIVCDKCAKVCPVDCIDIEPIKATGEVGKASDGSPIRLYAAKFDIDMAKCCYCGLCTTVCPTECLTMTKTFDYSEFDVRDMNYHYANLTPEQAEEKKALYEQFVKEKEELKKQSAVSSQQPAVSSVPLENGQLVTNTPTPKPAFRPTVKPSIPKTEEAQSPVQETPIGGDGAKSKPIFAPKKPAISQSTEPQPLPQDTPIGGHGAKPKPVFAPKKPVSAQPAIEPIAESSEPIAKPNQENPPQGAKPKPIFKPTKPRPATEEAADIVSPSMPEVSETTNIQPEPTARPKPIFKPTMKPATVEKVEEQNEKEVAQKTNTQPESNARPKPIFKPTMKPAVVEKVEEKADSEPTLPKENTDPGEVKPRPKPVFKPTMRPKKEE